MVTSKKLQFFKFECVQTTYCLKAPTFEKIVYPCFLYEIGKVFFLFFSRFFLLKKIERWIDFVRDHLLAQQIDTLPL